MTLYLSQCLGLFVLLVLSGFFSGAETALFSLTVAERSDVGEEGGRRARAVERLLADPARLLVTVLAGNTVVNVGIAVVATSLALDTCRALAQPDWVAVLSTVVIVPLVLLVFGEVAPKTLALLNARAFALVAAPPLLFFYQLIRPLTRILVHFAPAGESVAGVPLMAPEEIRTLLEISDEAGLIGSDERELIDSVVEFRETVAREIMVPRPDMACVEEGTTHAECLAIIRERCLSRIPAYRESTDQIVGILHAKDMLRFIHQESTFQLPDVMRSAYFVPEYMPVSDLLGELKARNTQMAIVVDEYGGTSGLVTMEDVLEELVGEIWDERDEARPLHEFVDDRTLLADARLDVDDLSEILGMDFEGEGYDTLGGLVLERLGQIPKAGASFETNGFRFVVERISRNRIRQVRLVAPEGWEAPVLNGGNGAPGNPGTKGDTP